MHTVLAEAVDRADAAGGPVTAPAIADSLRVPESELSRPLASLCQFELLETDIRLDDAVVLKFVEE